MRLCQRANNGVACGASARWQVGFKIWAEGFPKTSTPLRMILGLYVCDNHKDDPNLTVSETLSEETQERIREAFTKSFKKPPPDFRNAEFEYIALM